MIIIPRTCAALLVLSNHIFVTDSLFAKEGNDPHYSVFDFLGNSAGARIRNSSMVHFSDELQEKSIINLDQSPKTHNEKGLKENEDKNKENTIVVTGSHIRGNIAAGANIDIYDATDLKQSGYATVHEFIATIPQNYQGGGGGEGPSLGPLASSNQFGGSSVNLRGLGADSTLVLVNGRRLPASGLEGNFTDISAIPQTAIARIEVLTDGASALYGSDAVGGVVNIVLRKDFDGAETRFRYGIAPEGNVDEYRLAQTVGRQWSSGYVFINYEYYQRDALKFEDRSFTKTLDLRPFGGADHRTTSASPANILDPATFQPVYGIPTDQNGQSLAVSDLIPGQINLMDRSPGVTLLPKQRRHSILASAEQEITSNFETFFDFRYTQRKATNFANPDTAVLFVPDSNPFFVDPYGIGMVILDYSFADELGPSQHRSRVKTMTVGGGFRLLTNDWRWETMLNYGREKSKNTYSTINYSELDAALADDNPDTAFNPFGHGRINDPGLIQGLNDPVSRQPRATITNLKSIADGPVANFYGREISIAIGGEYRKEKFNFEAVFQGQAEPEERLSRNVYSVFAEATVPIFELANENAFATAFDLSLAARHDKYSDYGGSTSPRIGITWETFSQIAIKASYGKSYRAPNLIERSTSENFTVITRLPDPTSSTGIANSLVLVGNHPDTDSEKADIWTLGVTYKPEKLSGLAIGLNYFDIEYRNRISKPGNSATVLANEVNYPDLIIRNPSDEQLSALCVPPFFSGNAQQCRSGLIGVILDARSQNMARTKTRGLDAEVSYHSQIGRYRVSTSFTSTYLIDNLLRQTSNSIPIETVDTIAFPVDFRARAYVNIADRLYSLFLAANYTDAYKNNVSMVQNKIDSHLTIDASMSIDVAEMTGRSSQGVGNVIISVTNLFNNKPPFADTVYAGYDGDNFSPLGRVFSIEVHFNW